jgi:enoyl-CoA hydratase
MERLAAPFALEAYSPLTGEPILLVDFDAGDATRFGCSEARDVFAQLPCPTVALRRDLDRPAPLIDCFDVVLDDDRDLKPILDSVRKHPIACMSAVQLLRHSEGLSVHEGLIAESLMYSTLQSGPEFQAWLATHQRKQRPTNPERAVLMERNADVVELRFNRPEKRNAFSAEMRDAFAEGLQVALNDPDVKEVHVSAAGPAFCAGGDLDEFGSLPDPATAHAIRSTRNVGRMMHACRDRLRFFVHGACVGAGMELSAFANFVSAREGAFFMLPEIDLGLVPGAGGTVSIMRRVGRERTAFLALSRTRIDAETALSWGLVDEVRG